MTWRAPVHHVVDDVAVPVHHMVDDTASTCTLCGACHGEHRYTLWWMTWGAMVNIVMNAVASTTTFVLVDDDVAGTDAANP